MRSSEVARLAGVSVRTLRHYHQIGLLPEPERRSNGYREYGLATVSLLLRIRRLAGLGVPLPQVAAVLGGLPEEGVDVLEVLDRELTATIDTLTRRREEIAALRSAGGRPDLSAAAARLHEVSGPSGGGPMAQIDLDVSVLLTHVLAPELQEEVRRRLSDVVHDAERRGLPGAVARFGRLEPGSSDAEVRAVAEALAAALGPALTRFYQSRAGAAIARLQWPQVVDHRLHPTQAAAFQLAVDLLPEPSPLGGRSR